jgi:hypothetical protein
VTGGGKSGKGSGKPSAYDTEIAPQTFLHQILIHLSSVLPIFLSLYHNPAPFASTQGKDLQKKRLAARRVAQECV